MMWFIDSVSALFSSLSRRFRPSSVRATVECNFSGRANLMAYGPTLTVSVHYRVSRKTPAFRHGDIRRCLLRLACDMFKWC